MSITESLKAQLKTLEGQRREHERPLTPSVAMKRRSARLFPLFRLYPLSPSREPLSIRVEVTGEWTRVHSPFICGPSLME